MRRNWLIVVTGGLILALAALGVFLQRNESADAWDARIRLRFVAFHTNAAAGTTNAHFDIVGEMLWSTEVAWLVREVTHRHGENWIPWDPHTFGGVNIDWLHTSNGVDVLVPVETVHAPTRIVLELKQRRSGLSRVWDNIQSAWASFTGGDRTRRWSGPSFWMTNETVPLPPGEHPAGR